MLAPAYREQALVLGRKLARALAAGAATAARELTEQERRRRASEHRQASSASLTIARRPSRLRRAVARSIYGCFLVAVAYLALVLFNVELLLPAAWKPFFRLVAGATLLLGGLAACLSGLNIRTLLIEQLTREGCQPASRPDRVRGWRQRLLDPLLYLTGLAMLAAAAFEFARAIPHFA